LRRCLSWQRRILFARKQWEEERMSFSRNLKTKAGRIWEDGYEHPFVQELGKGTLDKGKFQFYLLQDYHYLLQYAKVFAVAAVKSDTIELASRFTESQYFLLHKEIKLHEEYMAGFGVTAEQMALAKPSLYNRAYTANMLSFGQTGGLAELLAAVFPCAWTYADYATRLKERYADGLAQNFYKTWIETYASEEFAQSFAWFYDVLDELIGGASAAQKAKIEEIFVSSVEFEYLFWDMAYKQELSYHL
jgi:thiaminase/transcriptional activator TenA